MLWHGMVIQDHDMGELVKLSGCGHAFCRPCWRGFIESKVRTSEVSGLTCMEMKCKMPVPDSLVLELVKDAPANDISASPAAAAPSTPADDAAAPAAAAAAASGGESALLQKYNRFLAESWVKEQPMVKFCPAAGCENAIDGRQHLSGPLAQIPIKCSCGQSSCWGCSTEQHAPASCKQVQDWSAKFESDHETQQYRLPSPRQILLLLLCCLLVFCCYYVACWCFARDYSPQ
eukprot:COSAG05_NODE_472_length_9495_cov_29.989783_2_plen_232_part_00